MEAPLSGTSPFVIAGHTLEQLTPAVKCSDLKATPVTSVYDLLALCNPTTWPAGELEIMLCIEV